MIPLRVGFQMLAAGWITVLKSVDLSSWLPFLRRLWLAQIRVFFADDHDAIREHVARMLAGSFDLVGTASDGEAALDAVKRLAPDVVVLDISMPLLSGIEVAERLKAIGSKAKIVFLTVHEDQDVLRAAIHSGARGYVIKSSLASDLIAAIKTVCENGRFISSSKLLRNRL